MRLLMVSIVLFLSVFCFGQPSKIKSIGLPFIEHYDPADYKFSTQSFEILTGQDNRIYIAGNAGLLVFDGHHYTRVTTSENVLLHSVVQVPDGTIYVAGNHEIGILQSNENGALTINSIKDQYSELSNKDFTIWRTYTSGNQVYFVATDRLFSLNHQTKEWFTVPLAPYGLIAGVNKGQLYAFQNQELYVLQNKEWKLVSVNPKSDVLATNQMVIVETARKSVVITNKGFYDFSTFEKMDIDRQAAQFLASSKRMNAVALLDSYIAIYDDNGLLITDLNGNPIQFLNESKGLSRDQVLDITLDQNNLLWVGTSGGFDAVEVFSPYTVLDERMGVKGVVSFITKFDDGLYLSATSGHFHEKWDHLIDPFYLPSFNRLHAKESWRTIGVEDDLIGLTSSAVYELKPEIKPIAGRDGIYWAGLRSRDSNELLLGSHDGELLHLKKSNGNWQVKKQHEKLFPSVHYMALGVDDNIWISERNFGIYRIKYDWEQGEILEQQTYGANDGLPANTANYVYTYQGDALVATVNGIYRHEPSQNRLIMDERFAALTEGKGVSKISEGPNGDLYYYTTNSAHRLKKTATGFQRIDFAPLKFDGLQEFHTEVVDSANVFWSTVSNIIHIDPRHQPTYNTFPVNLSAVRFINRDSVLFNGFEDYPTDLRLPFSHNSLRMEFAAAFYENIDKTRYRWKLEEFDQEWSEWNDEHQKAYTNLPHGTFTFRVQARNTYAVASEMKGFTFTVLPPWYYAWWAYGLYAALFVGFIWGIVKLNTRRLERDKLKLEGIIEERTNQIRIQKEQAEKDAHTISDQHEKLLQADELKSLFFTNISHELRTPLTLTMGTVDQTLKGKFGSLNDEQYANLKVSYRNSERLLKMVNNILDISKLEAGKVQLYATLVHPAQLLSKVGDFFSSKFFDKRIDYKEELLPEATLYLDKDKFETIFVNLLANAFRFTQNDGQIVLRMQEKEDRVVFSVSDTGVGIPETDLPFVFDRFYQSPHTKSGEGTGVGLALSKELVELHGATIAVESGVDKGTVFTLIFQKGKAHLQADQLVEIQTDEPTRSIGDKVTITELQKHAIAEESKPAIHPGEKKQHILIVEDNYEMSRFIAQILNESFEVSVVNDGQKGIDFLQQQKVDLIITDYLMPVMDGFEMAAEIKKDASLAEIPMMFLTARVQEQDKVDVLNLGVDDYLFKPFNGEELKARATNLLRAKQQRAEYWIEKSIDPRDIEWKEFPSKLKIEIDNYIKENIKSEINGAILAQHTGQSERSLQRKVKANTGLSLTQYIKEYRLRTARTLLEGKKVLTVSEASFAVGFSHLSNFTKNFKERFGKAPSAYLD
ncbi:MAG: response regulator [Cyclobacteriaceae bacterium]